MICRRCQELMSDFLEGKLEEPSHREMEAHLETCRACRELVAALNDVLSALGSFPLPEPPERLTELILDRTRPVLRAQRAARADGETGASFSRNLAGWLAAAAVLTGILLFRPPEFLAAWSRHVSQSAHQAYSYGVRTYHRTERWIEELNVLRMTVGVAFEDRLDRLNERLRDLEEVRRKSDDDENSRSELPSESGMAGSELGNRRSLV